jgi:GrpB-like predicted nucleotidyltransferase (UPF0157 family)
MAAGKTAVAQALAERLPRGVHLEGDAFRRSIVSGRAEMVAGPPPEALAQLRLPYRVGTAAADTCAEAGSWLDTSDLTPAETVDAILAETESVASSSRSPIVVVDYDASWPALFERIAAPVREAVADVGAEIEHVGSTAVPGLAAKPVVDVDVVVRAPEDVLPAIERLRGLGYVWQGDEGVRGREALLRPPGKPPHHLYVVVAGSRPHLDHVDFRDRMRRRPGDTEAYAALKRSLAAIHRDDRLAYGEAKSEFVTGVLRAVREERRS